MASLELGEAEERASKECVPAIIADDLQGRPRKGLVPGLVRKELAHVGM